MALRVRWSPRAADDLEAIAEYISLDSPAYAKSVIKTILEITRKFSQFPLAGRIVPEFNDENIREWFAYSYRIIYRLDQTIITVAAIVHGRRMLTMEDK
jgi:plasmid stabilization system protein ParE